MKLAFKRLFDVVFLIMFLFFIGCGKNSIIEPISNYSSDDEEFLNDLLSSNDLELIDVTGEGRILHDTTAAGKLRIESLDLSKLNLVNLPESINKLDSLINLNIEGNKLDSIPSTICDIQQNLDVFILKDNNFCKVSAFPVCIFSRIDISNQDCELQYHEDDESFVLLFAAQNEIDYKYEDLFSKIEWDNAIETDTKGDTVFVQRIIKLDWDAVTESTSNIPEELGSLDSLKELNLRNNNFTSLPTTIGQLQNLTTLRISNNNLTILPSGITRLTKLELLHVHSNALASLPTNIGNLVSLSTLWAQYNEIQTLPSGICAIIDTIYANLILDCNDIVDLSGGIDGSFYTDNDNSSDDILPTCLLESDDYSIQSSYNLIVANQECADENK